MKLIFDFNSQSFPIDLMPTGKTYRATVEDETVDVEIVRVEVEQGKLELLIDGQRVIAYVSSDGAKRWVTINGQTVVLTKSSGSGRKSSGQDQASGLVAPMPGVVRSVNVVEGEAVKKGQTLLTVEAMKMEIPIAADEPGEIVEVRCERGRTILAGETLLVLRPC